MPDSRMTLGISQIRGKKEARSITESGKNNRFPEGTIKTVFQPQEA